MKSTTKNNQLAFDVWTYVEECKMNGYGQSRSEIMTATMYSLSRQEVSDLYKSYQTKLNNQENSDELGVIA